MSQPDKQDVRSVGIEASVSAMTAVVLGADGRVAAEHARAVDGGRTQVSQLVEFINSLPSHFGEFQRLGIAVPGLVRRTTREVAYSAHIPEHSDLDLAGMIAAETGRSAVVENDANAAAYGEFRLGAGRSSSNLFYATLGRGVGGAFIFNGNIWHGAAGFAGEFGYVAINSDGMRLEDVASADNIVRRTRNRFNRDSTSSLGSMDETSIGIDDIISAAGTGDDFARLMLERTGSYVGTAVATVINLLNVETVVLGGPIMSAGEFVLEAVIRRSRELSFTPSFENTAIVAGTLGDNAAAIGSALLAGEL